MITRWEPHFDISQPQERGSDQPKMFAKDYTVMMLPLPSMEKFSYTSGSSTDCVIRGIIKCKICF